MSNIAEKKDIIKINWNERHSYWNEKGINESKDEANEHYYRFHNLFKSGGKSVEYGVFSVVGDNKTETTQFIQYEERIIYACSTFNRALRKQYQIQLKKNYGTVLLGNILPYQYNKNPNYIIDDFSEEPITPIYVLFENVLYHGETIKNNKEYWHKFIISAVFDLKIAQYHVKELNEFVGNKYRKFEMQEFLTETIYRRNLTLS